MKIPPSTHKMTTLAYKLVSIGTAVTEEDQVVTLLGSLPPSYSNIVTTLEARIGDLTLDFVQEQLIHHELKLKTTEASSPTDSSQDTALLS